MTVKSIKKNKGLVKAFKRYQKRYSTVGKKPNVRHLLANDLYHTMRLEGEKISRKFIKALFK